MSLFVFLLAAAVALILYSAEKTEKKIISETAGYIKNYLINLETADYSFSADILNKLSKAYEQNTSFTEEAEKVLSSYHDKTGAGFSEWLYGKNIRAFIKRAVSESLFLKSADFFIVTDGVGESTLFSGRSRDYSSSDLNPCL